MRTIYSARTGNQIPVTKDLNVQPLTYLGEQITTPSGVVMNDRWIYVNMPNYGPCAINVYRAHFCEKMYLAEVTIQESIGNKLMDDELKVFVENISDRLVFQKYGKWYRVFLEPKTSRTFKIQKIVPYNWVINPNMKVGNHYAHQCCIDWKSTFYAKRYFNK